MRAEEREGGSSTSIPAIFEISPPKNPSILMRRRSILLKSINCVVIGYPVEVQKDFDHLVNLNYFYNNKQGARVIIHSKEAF